MERISLLFAKRKRDNPVNSHDQRQGTTSSLVPWNTPPTDKPPITDNIQMLPPSTPKECEKKVFYDLEFTGEFNPFWGSIVEIGAVDEEGKRFHALLQQEEALPVDFTRFTGITQKEIEVKGRPACDALNEFMSFVGKRAEMVSHGGHDSDALYLREAFRRCKLAQPDWIFTDTHRISQLVHGQKIHHNLQNICWNVASDRREGDCYCTSAHRALDDAIMTKFVYEKLKSSGLIPPMRCDGSINLVERR